MLKILIEAGADLNFRSTGDFTDLNALMYAASTNANPDFVRVLLSAGADPNAQESHNGWTPMMMAAIDKLESNVVTLVNGGADINIIQEKAGLRAYDYAEGAKMSEATLKLLR